MRPAEKTLRTLTGHSQAIVALAFSHNGKILASTSDDRSIKLWNTSDWSLRKTLTVAEHTQAADFSPDDKMLLDSRKRQTYDWRVFTKLFW